jgi:acetyl-CoA carboxylase biotin carboxyl carrier protein
MDSKEIQELLKLVNRLELAEFKYKEGEMEFAVKTKFYSKSRRGADANSSYMPVAPSAPMAPQPTAPPLQATDSKLNAESDSDSGGNSPSASAKDNLVEIRSPIVGTFYRSSSPEKGPYVKPGDKVEVGSVVCIVEAMKLFNEIESEVSGKVVKIVVEDASPVEYDQLLFLIDPNG